MTSPSRPVLRYLGGKWRLAPWIVSHFPPHRLYVEPFGGAASVLLRKERSMGECYNDLDGEVVNLFRVLRDEDAAAELRHKLELTPFSRDEYDAAFLPAEASIERARQLIVRSYMGHGSSSAVSHKSTGFRASLVNRGGALPAGEWPTLPTALQAVTDRLKGVLIENRCAFQIIDRYDEDDALIYLDPPYMPATRSQKRKGVVAYHTYKHELTVDQHSLLLDRIVDCRASVVLSGYPTEIYDDRLSSWKRVEVAAHANGALDRTEVLWINPKCVKKLERRALPLLHHMEAAE